MSPKDAAAAANKASDKSTRKNKTTKKQELFTFGPIGKEVYERTYSRLKPDGKHEVWPETARRVVDGNLSFVDQRFHEPGERDKLYNLILKMDMIPAGRHLWVTGIPGRSFVNNCHSCGYSRKDLTLHFTFLFDELMKGGGVGSNYSSKYVGIFPPVFSNVELHIVCNPDHPNAGEFKQHLSPIYDHLARNRFVVDDSREGWCSALAEALRAVWDGRDDPLIIDVSPLRNRGDILKTFGGVSSGPAPLVFMLVNVNKLLNSKIGQKLSSLDVMQIDHEIATCVVSGNLRRSARMSIKSWSDADIFDFIHCKQISKDGDEQRHWSTNISVEVDEAFFRALRKGDQHASKVLHEVAVGMQRDGEPGFWNSSLSAVGELEYPFATNPCVVGETLVAVADGRLTVPIRELAEKGDDVPVYAWDDEEGRVEIQMGLHPRWTGKKPVFRVTLDDGSSFKATSNHKMVMLDGAQKTVEMLKPGDRLRNFTRYKGPMGNTPGDYWHINNGVANGTVSEHQMIGRFFHGTSDGRMLHHENEDKLDNRPENLSYVTHSEHSKEHGFENLFRLDGNPRWCGLSNEELIDRGSKLASVMKRAFTYSEWIEYASANDLPVSVCRASRFARFGEFRDACADKAGVQRGRGGYDDIEKICEECGGRFSVEYSRRETCFCSRACANQIKLKSETFQQARVAAVKEAGRRQSSDSKSEMLKVYLELRQAGREPMKKEWENACRERGVHFRLHSGTFTKYEGLKLAAAMVNHRVVSVERIGEEDVYNITVERLHNFAIVTNIEYQTRKSSLDGQSGVFSVNCGEISFGQFDVCCLGHINLERFANKDAEAREAFRLMTRFLMRATFGDILNPLQKEVVQKNRRIGVGFFGFAAWLAYQSVRFSESHHNKTIREKIHSFYEVCRKEAHSYAFQLRIPEPIKVTTIAPTGCLVPGSLVATEKGLARLGSLGKTDGPKWQDIRLKVGTDQGPKEATKFFVNGMSDVVTVETKHGYILRGTPKHRIKVVAPSGEWVWKRLDSLEEGDVVPLQMNQIFGHPLGERVDLPPFPQTYHKSQLGHSPEAMTDELAEFVGFFMGNGSIHEGSIRLSVRSLDTDVINHFAEMGGKLFGITGVVTPQEGCMEVAFNSVRLARWFELSGFSKTPPEEGHSGKGYIARIPDAVLATNSRHIYAAFLRGLFEADGSLSMGLPDLSNKSREFIADVKTVMLALGYPTSIKFDTGGFSGKPVYKIRLLNRVYATRWVEEIGFIGSRKSEAVRVDVSRVGQGDLIPVSKALLDEIVPVGHDARKSALVAYGCHQALSRDMVREACPGDEEMRRRLGYFYDEVVKADMDEVAMTYDLSVPENVTYVANGFVSHNSISNLPGTTSGCQPVFARHFNRRIVFGKGNLLVKKYEHDGYVVEDYCYDKTGNSVCVVFPCKDPLVAACEERGVDPSIVEDQGEISLSDHLAVQAMLQDSYSDNGISYTVNFASEIVPIDDIKTALRVHLPHLKGTTMMPEVHNRKQPPFERITKEEFEKSGIGKVSDAERSCTNGSCPIR